MPKSTPFKFEDPTPAAIVPGKAAPETLTASMIAVLFARAEKYRLSAVVAGDAKAMARLATQFVEMKPGKRRRAALARLKYFAANYGFEVEICFLDSRRKRLVLESRDTGAVTVIA